MGDDIDLACIEEALSFIDAGCDRDTWLTIALAIKSAAPGNNGFKLFNKWSKGCEKKYNEADANAAWNTAKPSRITIASLFYRAKQNGWQPGDGRAYIQPQSESEPDPKAAEDAAKKHKAALWIFDDRCRSIRGTIAEVYLNKARRLELAGDYDHVLRFCPNSKFGDEWHPALVALFRHIETDKRGGIHRTALRPDGMDRMRALRSGKEWDGKMMYGPAKGHAIKLTPHDQVKTILGIGEGIESSLSLRCLPEFGRLPVWACGNAGALKRFPVLPGVKTLWVAVDQDEDGYEASEAVADRWTAAGREVFLVNPREGNDVNDVIRRRQRYAYH